MASSVSHGGILIMMTVCFVKWDAYSMLMAQIILGLSLVDQMFQERWNCAFVDSID